MTEPNGKIEDEFLNDLESAVRKILKSPKRKSEHLSAINAGVKLAAIRHKISGGEDDKGFFSK